MTLKLLFLDQGTKNKSEGRADIICQMSLEGVSQRIYSQTGI